MMAYVKVNGHTRGITVNNMSSSMIKWNKKDNDLKWIGKIYLTPKEFLSLVPPIVYFEEKITALENKVKQGQSLESPHFEISSKGQFLGHEGRHRALLAGRLNEKKIPVYVWWYGGYRNSPTAKEIMLKLKTKKYRQGDYLYCSEPLSRGNVDVAIVDSLMFLITTKEGEKSLTISSFVPLVDDIRV